MTIYFTFEMQNIVQWPLLSHHFIYLWWVWYFERNKLSIYLFHNELCSDFMQIEINLKVSHFNYILDKSLVLLRKKKVSMSVQQINTKSFGKGEGHSNDSHTHTHVRVNALWNKLKMNLCTLEKTNRDKVFGHSYIRSYLYCHVLVCWQKRV